MLEPLPSDGQSVLPPVPDVPPRNPWEGVLDLVFPPKCAGCKRPGRWICAKCWGSVTWITGPVCPSCGRPGSGARCGECRARSKSRSLWKPPATRAVALYEGIAREAVRELKYHEHHNIATILGPLMAARLNEVNPVLVPVPLHSARRRARGYNQSELLARHIARASGVPLESRRLRRVRNTADQITLSAVERWDNVRGAFEWRGSPLPGTIVLVDDVCTTGSTLAACAEALRAAGMPRVRALVFARAIGGWTVGEDSTS